MPPSNAWVNMQQTLRHSMLEERRVQWAPARDLAAQLLLRLNDPERCWSAAAEWLCGHVGADRVDGGFHASLDQPYVPQVEIQREPHALPSTLDTAFTPRGAGDAAIWRDPEPTVFDDVARDRRLAERTRGQLQRLGTRSKLVLPVVHGRRVVGIFCADWREVRAARANLTALAEVSATVLGPLLITAQALSRSATAPAVEPPLPPSLGCLTEAERRVARLVAQGLSYKEVARRLDRSFSTVDHQLRSIRGKLGVASTARLSVLLARLWREA